MARDGLNLRAMAMLSMYSAMMGGLSNHMPIDGMHLTDEERETIDKYCMNCGIVRPEERNDLFCSDRCKDSVRNNPELHEYAEKEVKRKQKERRRQEYIAKQRKLNEEKQNGS